jgi:hypothetical protein
MTEQSSEPTLILQSSDTRIVVHGSLFVAWNGEMAIPEALADVDL